MMIGEVDVDGNGKIDFDEFVRMMNNATKIDKREGVELREAFKVSATHYLLHTYLYSYQAGGLTTTKIVQNQLIKVVIDH